MKATVNGITLAYDDAGRGIPLVFLHAFPLNRTMWEPQTTALATRYRAIAVDLRGHGESDAPLWHYTMDDAADDVRALLDQLAIGQAVLIGLSMGGYIGLAFHRRYADRLIGLVLADTRAQADTPEGRQQRFHMAQLAYRKGPAAVADVMLPKLLSPDTLRDRPGLVDAVRAMIEGNEVSGIAGDLMAMADRPDSTPGLASIACPTLVLVGAWDQGTPPADARFMADRIPGAHLTIIPHAGHLSNLEQPAAFTAAVDAFAAGLR